MDLPDLPTLPLNHKWSVDHEYIDYLNAIFITVSIVKTTPRKWFGGSHEEKIVSESGDTRHMGARPASELAAELLKDLLRKAKVRFDSKTAYERYIVELDKSFHEKYGPDQVM